MTPHGMPLTLPNWLLILAMAGDNTAAAQRPSPWSRATETARSREWTGRGSFRARACLVRLQAEETPLRARAGFCTSSLSCNLRDAASCHASFPANGTFNRPDRLPARNKCGLGLTASTSTLVSTTNTQPRPSPQNTPAMPVDTMDAIHPGELFVSIACHLGDILADGQVA